MIAERDNFGAHRKPPAEDLRRKVVKPPQPQAQAEPPAKQPVKQPPRKRRVRLRIDERKMQTSYGNTFRTYATPEEVVVDFGVAEVHGNGRPDGPVNVKINADKRFVMTYHSAKRLALLLEKIVRRHEERFGTMKVKSVRLKPPSQTP